MGDKNKKVSKKKIVFITTILLLIFCIGTITTSAVQVSRSNKHTELGDKYLVESNYEQAIVEFKEAIAINKKNVEARVGLGTAYNAIGEYDNAIEVLEEGIKILPNESKFYLKESESYILKGEIENALNTLTNGYEKCKDDEIKKEIEKIIKNIELIIEKNPIQVGIETKISVVQKDEDGNIIKNLKGEYTNSNTEVGSISKVDDETATFKGLAVGKDTVKAVVGGQEFTKEIEIKENVLENLSIIYNENNSVGDSVEFKIVGLDQQGQEMQIDPKIEYDESMADLISIEGQIVKIKYIKDGTFDFTASAEDISEKVSVNVEKRKYTIVTVTSGEGQLTKSSYEDQYLEDTELTLQATPAKGWHFVGWSGDLKGSENPITFKVDSNKKISAVFEVNRYVLNTSVEGNGDIGRDIYKDAYAHGTKVKLYATPKAGYRFDHWEGAIIGDSPSAEIVMTKETTVKAVFVKLEETIVTQDLTTNVEGNGKIVAEKIEENKYKLTATPDEGSKFVTWKGDLTGSENPALVILDKSKNITAVFEPIEQVATFKLAGQVINAKNNAAISGAVLKIREGSDNLSGNAIVEVQSNDLGYYEANLQKGLYTVEVIKNGFTNGKFNIEVLEETTRQLPLNPIESGVNYSYRIVLTWGQNPTDLDSYLTDNNLNKTLYYGSKTIYEAGEKIAELDYDKTNGFGPETVTIYKSNENSGYEYFIKDFTNSGKLYSSSAVVQVYKGGELVNTINVPNDAGNNGKNRWNVFKIENGQINVTNTLE